jgi:PAS domain S-box-containing protein
MGIITYVSISIGIGYPIDLMKKEQKNRIAGEERLSRITNNLQDVIIQINRNGIIQYISPSCSKVFGQDPEYYIGRSFYSEIHPEERKDVFEKIEMAFSRKDLELIQYRYSEEYGNYIWVESLGQVIAPYVTFFGLIAALFTGHRIKFEGKEFELGKVNEMMDKVAESVDSAKKKMAEDSISHE